MSQSFDEYIFRIVNAEITIEETLKQKGKLRYTSLDLGLRNSPYVRMVDLSQIARKKNGKSKV